MVSINWLVVSCSSIPLPKSVPPVKSNFSLILLSISFWWHPDDEEREETVMAPPAQPSVARWIRFISPAFTRSQKKPVADGSVHPRDTWKSFICFPELNTNGRKNWLSKESSRRFNQQNWKILFILQFSFPYRLKNGGKDSSYDIGEGRCGALGPTTLAISWQWYIFLA